MKDSVSDGQMNIQIRTSFLDAVLDVLSVEEIPISGGGFCDVYVGQLRTGRKVALKRLRVFKDSEFETVERVGSP